MELCYPGSKLQFQCKVDELRTIYGHEEDEDDDGEIGERLASGMAARWDDSATSLQTGSNLLYLAVRVVGELKNENMGRYILKIDCILGFEKFIFVF